MKSIELHRQCPRANGSWSLSEPFRFTRPAGLLSWSGIFAVAIVFFAAPRARSDGPAIDVTPRGPARLCGWMLAEGKVDFAHDACQLSAGTRLVYTEYEQRDFVLRLKYRTIGPQPAQLVIYYRSRFQAGMRRPVGSFVRLGYCVPTVRGQTADAPAWTDVRMRITGRSGSLEINGRQVAVISRAPCCFGHIALGVEAVGATAIAVKQIDISELGYTPLLNGRDLSGWEGADQDASLCWQTEGDKLVCTGAKGPWLRSLQSFGDFNLRLEYKLQEGGNSGVYIRVPPDGRHHGAGAGVEIQVLDDQADRYRKLKPYQFSGSVYAVVAAKPRVARPAGNWNSLEINCRADRYTIRQNGVVVVDADAEDAPELGQRRMAGRLGLQNHSEAVWFRHLRIGPSR